MWASTLTLTAQRDHVLGTVAQVLLRALAPGHEAAQLATSNTFEPQVLCNFALSRLLTMRMVVLPPGASLPATPPIALTIAKSIG